MCFTYFFFFLDTKKAFDYFARELLFYKFEKYGVRGITNKFVLSFLSRITQQVKINKNKNEEQYVKPGVPQGTVLATSFFIVYINDLLSLDLGGSTFCFGR